MALQSAIYKKEKPCIEEYTQAIVEIPTQFVSNLYNYALKIKQSIIKTRGFELGKVPLLYIQKNYHTAIIDHITEVLFVHYAYEQAIHKLHAQQGILISNPLLTHASLDPLQNNNHFAFNSEHIAVDHKASWKQIKIKFPARKKYKDLDRQAEVFTAQERSNKTAQENIKISQGDWVQFSLVMVDPHTSMPFLENHQQLLWLRISNEDVDKEAYNLFVNKKKNEEFLSNSVFFNRSIAPHSIIVYTFKVKIMNIVSHAYFCIDSFQSYFSLKSSKDVHNKLIEVLSFRNDVSLRREMMQLVFHSIVKNYYFTSPERLIEAQHQFILSRVIHNPDYLVYQAQKDFFTKVSTLAEKQVREAIITDYVAHNERIEVSNEDVLLYMGLMQRSRLRDFIYFDLLSSKNNVQEKPIPHVSIVTAARREKTLNHMLSYLTKNN